MKRSGGNRPTRPRNARITWDEANLEYLDANRTPKQKILEPKTPYHAPAQEDGSISPIAIDEDRASADQAVQAQEICAALIEAASASSSQSRLRGGWTSSEDEGDEIDQDAEGKDVDRHRHNVSFVEHRKAHYDEYRKVKKLQESSILEPPEDADDSGSEEESLGVANGNKEPISRDQMQEGKLMIDNEKSMSDDASKSHGADSKDVNNHTRETKNFSLP